MSRHTTMKKTYPNENEQRAIYLSMINRVIQKNSSDCWKAEAMYYALDKIDNEIEEGEYEAERLLDKPNHYNDVENLSISAIIGASMIFIIGIIYSVKK